MKSRTSSKKRANVALISQLEPKVNGALNDESWVKAIKDELKQFGKNNVWTLIPKPKKTPIIGTKWIFRNKMNESGKVAQKKLV